MSGIRRGLAAAAWLLAPGMARADGVFNVLPAASTAPADLFPNWVRAHVGQFNTYLLDDATGCANGPVTGLTVLNFGNCLGSPDVSTLYWRLFCNKTDSGTLAMTYAGTWLVGGLPRAAWTWVGSIPWGANPETDCAGAPALSLYADIGACPADECTIQPVIPQGALADACGFAADVNYDAQEQMRTVRYVTKRADRDVVAPGDTMTYTVYYGLPGAGPLPGITVTDTLPGDTTYVSGSALPPPDVGWDPDPGPPLRLRWSLPGGPTAGGATREVRFSVSVNWGNEPFDPGSGALGAVEGARLGNVATVDYVGSGCAPGAWSSGAASVTVRRYLMWMLGDQDLLLTSRMGMPEDEVIYEVFVRNESATKTWWGVTLWDTVPSKLSVWGGQYGFDDPCLGWTMTPSGCAAASPGWYLASPGNDVLTWRVDLPPGATMSLRWKARVAGSAVDGDTAMNIMALQAAGQLGLNGSGSARAPRTFVHLAPIALRTTYFSYVGHAAHTGCSGDFLINFYPLNKATDFEFRKIEYNNVLPFVLGGGVSASINTFVGTCVAGFPESMGGNAGCKVERTPAQYYRACSVIVEPYTYAYKVTSNAPVIWMYMWANGWSSGDSITYLPATTLSFAGWTLYTWRRGLSDTIGEGDNNYIMNTGQTPSGAYDPAMETTVHIFKWDMASLSWQYVKTGDLGGESAWVPIPGTLDSQIGHYKFISSNTKLEIWQGYNLPISGQGDHGTQVPNAQTGLLVSPSGGPAHFYPVIKPNAGPAGLVIGNVEPGNPTNYALWKYRADNPVASPGIPAVMAGTSGRWTLKGFRSVGAGLNDPANGYAFGPGAGYDGLLQDPVNDDSLYKVEWLSGGRIQVQGGAYLWDGFSGGSQLHGADGVAGTGQEFWIHTVAQTDSGWCKAGDGSPYNVMVFCPAQGMVVNSESGSPTTLGGAFASYTTTGPDQVVCFMGQTEMTTPPARRNWRFWLDPGGVQGDLMALYTQCRFGEKFYTAPFTHTGAHYDIIAPPVVYSGQSFWITIVVVQSSGSTDTNYTGTTSFTSTDPGALLEAGPLDAYNYTWQLANAGVKVFVKVTLTPLGYQTIIAADILDGSIIGLTTIQVVGVDVKLTKMPPLQVAASGDTVQFRICWSNYSTATAASFTITDAVPNGTVYVPDTPSNHLCGATKGFGAATVAYSSTTNTPGAYLTMTGPATTAVTFLRWTIPTLGVATTGCVCFRVAVQ